ncbi:E3 ubiquitin-protein ligase CBL-B-like [Boleophthalmus pectinirostris]|uniref:E3 ubiquitin-protein ligase CBL-B-like n=1 Tax=Boleophthalmus pectinirostris TaxID=150288 RepID=UPI00242CBD72|nr:E3 ubiquitin-protein ligase CBL-B-like [Boleophthalmus pectinirostris]
MVRYIVDIHTALSRASELPHGVSQLVPCESAQETPCHRLRPLQHRPRPLHPTPGTAPRPSTAGPDPEGHPLPLSQPHRLPQVLSRYVSQAGQASACTSSPSARASSTSSPRASTPIPPESRLSWLSTPLSSSSISTSTSALPDSHLSKDHHLSDCYRAPATEHPAQLGLSGCPHLHRRPESCPSIGSTRNHHREGSSDSSKPFSNGVQVSDEYDILPTRLSPTQPCLANSHKSSNPFSSPAVERKRGAPDRPERPERPEDEYQIPSSNLCLSQAPLCISVPTRHLENGSPEPHVEERKTRPDPGVPPESGSRGAPVSSFNANKTPCDYDILLPASALEDPFNSRPPSQPPPPPPPARHSFVDLSSSSSSSSSCNSSSSSAPSRPHRPCSGHEHLLLTPDTVFDMLNNAAPLPPVRRHAENTKGLRGCLDPDLIATSQVSMECLQAPARPPKPLPRNLHSGKPHGLESENVDAKIAKLMGEGYSFEDVKRALMIAQNKVDVARNILREFALVPPRLHL